MIGWLRNGRAVWHGRSRHAQVEASTRWSLFALPWIMLLAGLSQVPTKAADTSAATAAAWAVLGVHAVLCAATSVVVGRALRAYLGERPPPWLGVAVLGVLAALAAGLTAWLLVADSQGGEAAEGMVLMVSVGAFLMPYALLMPVRVTAWTLAGVVAALTGVFAAVGVQGGELGALAAVAAVGGLAMGVSTRSSAWYIAVMRELDDARETQARLAVAEERLRFGRDLHDVLGRNLSVIALKSELAGQLARRSDRGPEAALDQMVEVQRIARDSQREVRDVVRGYREADLATELAGARGVLRAAGIDCRVTSRNDDDRLPPPVRAALGWVVREGATNVLRHADASRCDVTVRVERGAVVLVMENDGARDPGGRPRPGSPSPGEQAGGAGLAGLGERLTALHGVLTAERPSPGTFRLTVEIPLSVAAPGRPGARAQDATAATGEADAAAHAPPAPAPADERARPDEDRDGQAPDGPRGPAGDPVGRDEADMAGVRDGGPGAREKGRG
ncbi:histidine kinase [Streptomyces sp. DSM 42041]|uniref:Histidine kinase n=1 Tax=Streptomyces hazeniae TaxID=3075538 RepID=A0ABU2NRX5_9ACTN|nr:histidine kinase [Streptomyces sp. DSM 42041]MDT0379737.1 histidine kinase [Streptomyces sp. DSM 42041]